MLNNFFKNKEDIGDWLLLHNVKNFSLLKSEKYEYIVDAKSDVILDNLDLNFIPIKFNKINGHFSFAKNKIKNLDFSPIYVRGEFDCSENELTNLLFAPNYVGGEFNCSKNSLMTLEGAPKEISFFNCANNILLNLNFCPKVSQILNCSHNYLRNLNEINNLELECVFADHNKIDDLNLLPKSKLLSLKDNEKLNELQNLCDRKEIAQKWLLYQLNKKIPQSKEEEKNKNKI